MICFSIGMPGAFADWCETVLAELAQRKFGAAELVRADTLEDLATNIIKSGAPHIVACSRMPNYRLAKTLADAKTNILFVLDDPRAAITYLMTERRMDLVAAIQAVANSYACLTRCAILSNALVLVAARHGGDPLVLIRLIGRHFGFPVAEAGLPEIAAGIRAKGLAIDLRPPEAWWNGLDNSTKALIDGATSAYAEYFSAGRLSLITWHRDLFLNGDTRKPLTQAIDMTGHARLLICGPSIQLPRGSWTAQVVFGCSNEAAGVGLMLDVFAGAQLSQTRYQPSAGGVFEVSLKFTLEETNDSPVEIRISSEKAILDGRLSLSHVHLSRESAQRMVQNPALSAELGLEAS